MREKRTVRDAHLCPLRLAHVPLIVAPDAEQVLRLASPFVSGQFDVLLEVWDDEAADRRLARTVLCAGTRKHTVRVAR